MKVTNTERWVNVELAPDDDRVVGIKVKTNEGTYEMVCEFLAQEFGDPDVQVRLSKVREPRDTNVHPSNIIKCASGRELIQPNLQSEGSTNLSTMESVTRLNAGHVWFCFCHQDKDSKCGQTFMI